MVSTQLVRDLTAAWGLSTSGPTARAGSSWHVPVDGDQGRAVLVIRDHPASARDQARTLTTWDGRHAVRLLAADPGRAALLLERLDPRDLSQPPVTTLDSCEHLGRLARELDRPAPPWLRDTASARLRALADDLTDPPPALPRRLAERGRALAAELSNEPAIDTRLVHAGLHHEHVLWRPDPGEWVAISPTPVAADATWVVAPALLHRWADTAAAHNARTHLNFRLDVICDVAGINPDRARAVSELRILSDAVEHVRSGASAQALTRHVTIIKALQPA